MSTSIVIKAKGLNTQPNALGVPDGSLTQAENVIIRRDDVVEPRRGFKLDGETFGATGDLMKQIMAYRGRILRHWGTTLQFEDGLDYAGLRKFTNFSGSYAEASTGSRIKSIQANGNLYFTSAAGIKKISAKSGTDLASDTGFITQSGGVKAIDIETELTITQGSTTGFLPQDSAVAYRLIWALKDKNTNLIQGTPSQRAEIYNPISSLILTDYSALLGALDDANQSTSLITDGNYVSTLLLTTGALGGELKTSIINLVSKIDNDILYGATSGAPLIISSAAISSGVCTITFSSGNPSTYLTAGDRIYLSGFTPATTGFLNGIQTVLNANSTTLTFVTAATGAVTLATPTITCGEFRYISANGTIAFPTPLSTLTIDEPTPNQEWLVIQNTISRIITALQNLKDVVVPSAVRTDLFLSLDITTTANVEVDISIPSDVTDNHFYQLYRSAISQATDTTVLSDLTPSDEMQLVYEAYPTSAELTSRTIKISDVTPDAFRGANLYTNEATGEGTLQSNEVPPFAKDINSFKNSIFYANTKTRHKLVFALLGVQQMITDAENNGTVPEITVSNGTTSNTYTFVTGRNEQTDVVCTADTANSLNGKYFTINAANDLRQYYVWFKTSGGTASDPAISGKTGIRVMLATGDSAATVATKIMNTLSRTLLDFQTSSVTSGTVHVVTTDAGYTTNASAGTSGFTVNVTVDGRGENVAAKQILLSELVSPAQAVDETARSMVRVINKNQSESVYVYYLSAAGTVPGKMVVESRGLADSPFYILGNNSITGASFNPDISPDLILSSITTAGLVTTTTAHGMLTGDKVVINGSTTTPVVDGLQTITYVSPTSFKINPTITVGDLVSPAGVAIQAVNAAVSENETLPNRIYYSKQQQPEAVPLVNYFDVGASDKAILRIFPLKDSLFVFKEDGVFRISGETTPFNIALFDSSCILIAPDSLAVSNNLIYGWTTQGISSIAESGATPAVSRPIDVDLLKLSTPQYTNFKTATFGVGYESDNSYLVWTVSDYRDTVATNCYRFSNLTNTWTTYSKTNTCGLVHPSEDRLYLGAGDVNSLETERKDFSRYDYCDREIASTVGISSYQNKVFKLNTVDGIAIGDVLVQDQTLSAYDFNSLLERLDIDTSVTATNYYSSLMAKAGDNMRSKLLALTAKLDADTGVASTDYTSSIASKTGTLTAISIDNPTVLTTSVAHGLVTGRKLSITSTNSTPNINGEFTVTVLTSTTFSIPTSVKLTGTSGSYSTDDNHFDDVRACYNTVINKLNADTQVNFANFSQSDTNTVQETIVTGVDRILKTVKVSDNLDYTFGPITIYKAIQTTVTYAPHTMGDSMGYKHLREATVMFENKAFTNAKLSFATDLLPEFIDVPFNGDGNGIFGMQKFGSGLFGGGSHSAPFRTYIPRNCQRCRYIVVKYQHAVAREQWAIYGISVTGEISQSTRAYR